jgi:hypothetical protein
MTEPLTQGELMAVVGTVITNVMATDLDNGEKRIVVIALEQLGKACEQIRRRRRLN